MDADYERAIDEELEKLKVNLSDTDSESYTDVEEDSATSGENQIILPDSVFAYVEMSSKRLNTFEQLMLENLDDTNGAPCSELPRLNLCDDLLNELTSTAGEDPAKLKEILSEVEEQVASQVEQNFSDDFAAASYTDDQTEYDSYKECESRFISEWRELEKRLRREEERLKREEEEERLRREEEERLARLEVEREHCLERDKERRSSHEELRSTEKVCLFENIKSVEGDEGLSTEIIKQQELIQRLEEQLQEERRMFEMAQQEEQRRTMEQRCSAVMKLQAAFRGSLVRRWSRGELIKRREEERRRENERKNEREERERRRKREEKLKREQEEKARREAEERRRQREQVERRRAEYERAKEQERHRLERERELQERARKEEEEEEQAERVKNERNAKVDEEKRRRMEEKRAEEERREIQKEVKEREEKKRQEEVKKMEDEQIKRGNESEQVRDVGSKKREIKDSRRDEGQVIKNNDEKDEKSQGNGQKEQTRTSVTREDEETNDPIEQREGLKVNNTHGTKNTETLEEEEEERTGELVLQPCLLPSEKVLLTSPCPSSSGPQEQLEHPVSSAVPTASIHNTYTHFQAAWLQVEADGAKPEMDTRGRQHATMCPTESVQECSSFCLPDSTEQKRLAWMLSCTPWSKLSMHIRRKGPCDPPRRRMARRALGPDLPPLPVDTVLKSGPWSSLKQVTTVTLEDLPSCCLSTLSGCSRLQSLTLRRCGLRALEGLGQCSELKHVDLRENSIAYVDCGGLARLEVLLLGRNRLASVHGMEGAANLTILQLSHNVISRISGLGSLKRLQRLSVDHNQLISTRGLGEVLTLVQLDCSYNHLSQVDGLETCALLNTLDLRGNSLTELPVLRNHVLLRELYVDENSVSCLQGLASCWLPLLRCLSLAHNCITQLPHLMDLISLRTLDVSNNCLSDLTSVCESLQGCWSLQELNLTNNPLQHEHTWRSSVLAIKPNLVKLNGELTGASTAPSVGSAQLYSFQALCQAHQDQLDSVLQKQSRAISSAPSALDAQLMAGDHSAELFRLAEEQRYAHEYGDSSVCEPNQHQPGVSDLRPSPTSEHSPETLSPSPAEPHTRSPEDLHTQSTEELHPQSTEELHPQSLEEIHTLISEELHPQRQLEPHLSGSALSTHPSSIALPAACTGGSINPPQKLRAARPCEDEHSKYPMEAPRMHLKIVASVVIQRWWRTCRERRRRAPAKAHGRLSSLGMLRSSKYRTEPLNKHYAASVIQAVWRGFSLRRRLAQALALARSSSPDHDVLEEVDVAQFICAEEAMDCERMISHHEVSLSKTIPYVGRLPMSKPPPLLSDHQKSASALPWKLRQAWTGSGAVSQWAESPDTSAKSLSPAWTPGPAVLSERSEKILEEWGFSNSSTGLLMLKRAQRMKVRKHQKRSVMAGRAGVSVPAMPEGEMGSRSQHRPPRRLHPPALESQRSCSTPQSDRFLPELDAEVLNGGRVQLVAGAGNRDGLDSVGRLRDGASAASPPCLHQPPTYTRSQHHTEEASSPGGVTSAPPRKERISFRDNPVRQSGGWGGGRRRTK
ncbi:leucine-rich repeat- and IQ domain-containing protein 1 isoform X3 [Brachyhypopomus gauderio]|uniref:leucine-rich repeat- and IQ domain-containing protein 1 isoform X3 n=1 Tax=Brachyhypopomus gauderio TaxID=698409 RepID=UPI004041C3E9